MRCRRQPARSRWRASNSGGAWSGSLVRLLGVALLAAIVAFLYYSSLRSGSPGGTAAPPARRRRARRVRRLRLCRRPRRRRPGPFRWRRSGRPAGRASIGRRTAADLQRRRARGCGAGRPPGAARGGRVTAGAARGGADADRRVLDVGERGRDAHAVADGWRRRAPRVRRSAVDHADGRQRRRTLGDAERPACPRARRGRSRS